jgi:galactokinase
MHNRGSQEWNERLAVAFTDRYGCAPTHLSRAPGRVNLLGEHTDYNDLPVLPMALQREARLAFTPRDDSLVTISNLDADFPDVEFEIHPGIPKSDQGHWENYCKAPADELARRFAIWRGFDAIFASTVPVAAGLSSSSALVNAVGLALAHINEVGLGALPLADVMADAERYTGTRGGGMDQAISMAGRAGCAARIDFAPLRMTHLGIPDDWCVVVADTGVRAEKTGPVQAAYNRRREECETAFGLVSEAVKAGGMTSRRLDRYPDLLSSIGGDAALAVATDILDRSLVRRFRHVITEALRVREAADLLVSADLDGFGDLMDASHGSLHTDYHVSSPDLDELVAIAREGGAAGARLTGAGFGGCTVSLSDRGSVDGVIEALVAEYYEPRGLTQDLDDRLFVAVPSEGATVGDF